jgi:rhodanese-related sulfurtransferase
MKSILLTLVFFLSGLLPAFAAADFELMTKEELKPQLGNSELIVIDGRLTEQMEASGFKLPGAVWLPDSEAEIAAWAKNTPKNKTVVTYCACNGLGRSATLASKLIAQGFSRVYVLEGGWKDWERSKYPVEKIN